MLPPAWSTINEFTDRSGRSFHLYPVLANSIASQLVKNGAHRTGDRQSTRLVNKQLFDLCKVPTAEGYSISDLFYARRASCRPQAPEARKVRVWIPSSRSLYSTRGRLSNLGFAISSLPACANSKIPKIWRIALIVAIPKPEKSLGHQKSYRPISLLCVPFKSLERLIFTRVETLIDPL